MRLTRDDERARRICSLALEFMNATSPVPSSHIARDFYPDLSADSFRRAFSRDRETLAACGVVVTERPVAGDESLWAADAESSFAQGAELGAAEAAALQIACRPLLEDADFPFAGELRFALAKLTRAFAESVVEAPTAELAEGRALATLRTCLTARRAARVEYVDARGRRSERTIAPYGLFGLRGTLYLVAARLGEDCVPVDGGVRTYRIDRVASARELPGVSFEVPGDFAVADWRRLPFQMGPERLTAVFLVPASREADVRRAAGAQGAFSDEGGELVWTVPASSAADAASWAVAEGVRPVAPEELVREWRGVLEGVLAHVR